MSKNSRSLALCLVLSAWLTLGEASASAPVEEESRSGAASLADPVAQLISAIGAVTAKPAAEAPCEPQTLVVGYQADMSLLTMATESRAVRVLKRAFPEDCFSLTYKKFQKSDLWRAISTGQIQFALMAIAQSGGRASAFPWVQHSEVDGVDMLLVHPASYSVVAVQDHEDSSEGLTSRRWLTTPLGMALGLVSFAALAAVLNIRFPRWNKLKDQAFTRIDPLLSGPRAVLRWMWSTGSGRWVGALWAVFGGGLGFLLASEDATLDLQWPSLHELHQGAAEAAYPGNTILEYRNSAWRDCDRPNECLRNYARDRSLALAGDRDLLCHYTKEAGTGELNFQPGIGVPIVEALLLLSSDETKQGALVQDAKRLRLEAALSDEELLTNPWQECGGS
jgi:hypothetical protein